MRNPYFSIRIRASTATTLSLFPNNGFKSISKISGATFTKADILITAEELPVQESWLEICKELERNDLTGASCRSDGILIEFEQ